MIRTPSLRSLELFCTLMTTRSLTNTAKRIGVSQPAASLALKELETQTGLSLFIRSRQRIIPTPQAEALLPHVERLLAQADAVQRRIVTMQDTSAATLHVACIPSFGSTLLPQIIAAFKRKQARIQVRVDVQPFARVLDLVRQEAAELGFAYVSGLAAATEEPLLTVALSCLLAKSHPLAGKKRLRLQDLTEHTIFVATQGYIPIPPLIMETLGDSNERQTGGVMEVNHVYTAMSLARAGLGVALANPMLLVGDHTGELVAKPFDPEIPLTLGVLRPAANDRMPATGTFVEQARLAARQGAKRLRQLGIKAEAV